MLKYKNNILYIHHDKYFSGSTKSLIEMLKSLNTNFNISASLITPKSSIKYFKELGFIKTIPVNSIPKINNSKYGGYFGIRLLFYFKELLDLPFFIFNLFYFRCVKKMKFNIIHVNESVLILAGILAKLIFKARLVVHIRSIQNNSNYLSKLFFKLYKFVDQVVVIDKQVNKSLIDITNAKVIHNFINLNSNLIKKKISMSTLYVGFIGSIIKSKGIINLIKSINNLVNFRKYDIKLIIAGDDVHKYPRFFNFIFDIFGISNNLSTELKKYIKLNNLENNIKFIGRIDDIKKFYSDIDILVFPSFLDSCGRPVFEAGHFAIPVIVAVKNPTDDIVVNGKTGITISYPSIDEITNSLDELYNDRKKITFMGNNNRKLAMKNFNAIVNTRKLKKIYDNLINNKGRKN